MAGRLNPDDVVESLRQRRALMQTGRGPSGLGGRGYSDNASVMTTSQHFEAARMEATQHQALSQRTLPQNRRPLQSNRPMHSGVFGGEATQSVYSPSHAPSESRALVAKRDREINQYTADRHLPPQPPVTNINALRWKMRS